MSSPHSISSNLPKLTTPRSGWLFCTSQQPCEALFLGLAQVSVFSGAGVQKGVGPAPLEGVECRFPAQVPTQKAHLRQERKGPAPCTPDTCSKILWNAWMG